MDIEKIRDNPYYLYLLCKLPFATVNQIVHVLNKETNLEWIQCIVKHIYKKSNNVGKQYLSKPELTDFCSKEGINVDLSLILPLLFSITVDKIKYYTTYKIHDMEIYIENFCSNTKATSSRCEIHDMDKLKQHFLFSTMLTSEQLNAIAMIMNNNISIITGSPGTGKSYVISYACKKLIKKSQCIILAPTRTAVEKLRYEIKKQAKNAPIVSSVDCKTIDSYLYCKKKDVTNIDIQHDTIKMPSYNIFHDRQKLNIIIDEMSMVSVRKFYKLLKQLEREQYDIKLILSGDKNQLPSIQGGNLFGDLIEYGKIPITELTVPHRTKIKTILENAMFALNGQDIVPDNDAVIFIESEKEMIQNNLIGIIKKYNLKPNNTCVLIPQRKKGICTNEYNVILQKFYNQNGAELCQNNNFTFRIKDKLINRNNDKEKGVFNGSILTAHKYMYDIVTLNEDKSVAHIQRIINNKIRKKCTVKNHLCDKVNEAVPDNDQTIEQIKKTTKHSYIIDGNYNHELICEYHEDENILNKGLPIKYPEEDINNLELAYAITIHSAQGKGYDTVIIIVHSSMYYGLLTRKILYTAITRSRNRCIIIGDKEALNYCKKIDPERITNLYRNR